MVCGSSCVAVSWACPPQKMPASPQREARTSGKVPGTVPLVLASRCGLAGTALSFRTLLLIPMETGDRLPFGHATQIAGEAPLHAEFADVEQRVQNCGRQVLDRDWLRCRLAAAAV